MDLGYADVHCHMLPGVDDGSSSMEMTMSMLQMAYQDGARRIFFTPHFISGENRYHTSDLDDLFHKVKDAAKPLYQDLELYLGNEVYYESDTCDHLKAGHIHTMNGTRYVLIEFPVTIGRVGIFHAVVSLVSLGYYPIIAHVERYMDLMKHVEDIPGLIDSGAYLQMNTKTVVGKRFDRFSKKCHKLIVDGYISFLGSDAHNTEYRQPRYEKAAKWVKKHIDYPEDILFSNSDYLISGESF